MLGRADLPRRSPPRLPRPAAPMTCLAGQTKYARNADHDGSRMDNSRIGPPQGYLPIEEHGIVGDLRTVALIGTDGTVDWYCPSRFDAPSLFGALLDANTGGYFSLTSRTGYARPN